ncbi:MAG: hypothetical protein AB7K52_11160 [Phycisphaerales bacterium]
MLTRHRTLITAFAIGAASGAGITCADTVTMSFEGTGRGSNVRATFFDDDAINVFAGQLRHDITSGTGQAAALVGEHRTFCADFDQRVSSASSMFTVVAPVDLLVQGQPLGADRAQALLGIFFTFGSAAINPDATNDFAAAFQLAVWEILYDFNADAGASSLNLTGGNIRFTKTSGSALGSGIVNQFNTIVGAIASEGAVNGLFGLQSGVRQDQLIYGNSLVPAPGALAVAAMGALAVTRRRRAVR